MIFIFVSCVKLVWTSKKGSFLAIFKRNFYQCVGLLLLSCKANSQFCRLLYFQTVFHGGLGRTCYVWSKRQSTLTLGHHLSDDTQYPISQSIAQHTHVANQERSDNNKAGRNQQPTRKKDITLRYTISSDT